MRFIRQARVALFAFTVVMLTYDITHACSPRPPVAQLKCGGKNIVILRLAESDTQPPWRENVHKTLTDVAGACDQTLPAASVVEPRIVEWLNNFRISGRSFLYEDLVFEPYSPAREGQLRQVKTSLFSCQDDDFERVDDWLIIIEKAKPYCQAFAYAGGACPEITFSLGQLLLFLVVNPSLTTLPYLAGFLLAIAFITGLWIVLLKRPPLISRRRLAVESMVGVPLAILLIFFPMWLAGQVAGWVLGTYLLARWLNRYLLSRRHASRRGAY